MPLYFFSLPILKCQEPEENLDTTSPLEEDDEMLSLLKEGEMSEDEKRQYSEMMRHRSYQPMSFSQIHAYPFKNQFKEEKFKGFKFVLGWNPTQFFNLEHKIIFDRKLRNYKLNATAFAPDSVDPNRAIQLAGMNDSGEKQMVQAHWILNQSEKITFISQYGRPDYRSGMYDLEFTKSFDRLETTVKMSNMAGNSLSLIGCIAKDTFAGFEVASGVIK